MQKLALIQIQENRSFKYLLLSLTFILEPNDKTPDFSQSPGHLPQKPSPFTHFYLNFHISLTFSLLLAAHFSEVRTIINSNLKPLFRQSATSTKQAATATSTLPAQGAILQIGRIYGQKSADFRFLCPESVLIII